MQNFYSPGQLALQKRNGSTPIAKQLKDTRLLTEFNDDTRNIVNESQFFFIATSGTNGKLDCSYKGGNTGFVQTILPNQLAFANYDGNGMYRTLGNIEEHEEVALLFIQFEGDKRRMRVNGKATITKESEWLMLFPHAESVTIVDIEFIFPNCPRYIHTMRFEETSIYSPSKDYAPPEPFWKSKPDLSPFLKRRRVMKNKNNDLSFESNTSQYFLTDYYKAATASPIMFNRVPDAMDTLLEVRRIEDEWMQWEDKLIESEILPSNSIEFKDWYTKKLIKLNDNIHEFLTYIRKEAPPQAIAYYICMEELVDGSFDDVMALAQIGVNNRSKLTIAENYWDEMGKGEFEKIHTEMFEESAIYCKKLLEEVSIALPSKIPTPCLMNGNLVSFWAQRRKYIPRLFGAIGLIEGSAPLRFRAVTKGMERCNFPEEAIAYHREHIHIDAVHGKEWLNHILLPHVESSERLCQEMARGVLIRFRVAEQYYKCIENVVKENFKFQ